MERDHTAGGGLLSGAIAFRLFLWTLPMALVAVAGLGFLSDVNSTSPSDAVRGIGIHSIPAQSINQAAQDSRPARWWALLLGLILLYLASVSLMKALWAAHALLWRMEPPRITNKPRAVAWLVVALMAALVGSSLAAIARGDSTFGGLVAMLADGAVYAGIWWAVSTQLPHGDAPARALWPGALLFGLGTQAIHLFIVYFLAARVTSASRLYGGLGIAAQLLLGLYVIARLMVEAAVLNETLWTRNHAKQGDGWRVQG